MQHRTRVPVLPKYADRILRSARREENGCLTSLLTPSQKRPQVTIPGGAKVRAPRVVMAVHLGRPIEIEEDVHHKECRSVRCVEPSHLAVISAADHQAHHGAERRLEICPRHKIPYAFRDRRGRPHCRKCQAEADARYRARTPLTDAQKRRQNELARLRRLTPEGGAKARAREKASRERRAARAAAA